MKTSTAPNTLGITLTEVPAEKSYRSGRAALPALDPAVSPLALERITLLENHHKETRDLLGKLVRAEQGMIDLVNAFHEYDTFVRQHAKTLFMPPGSGSIREAIEFHVEKTPDAPSNRERMAAETLRLILQTNPRVTSLHDAIRKSPRVQELVEDAIFRGLEFSSTQELEPLFSRVLTAQRTKTDLYDRLVHTGSVTLAKLTNLAKEVDDAKTTEMVQDFCEGTRGLIRQAQPLPAKKGISQGIGALVWAADLHDDELLRELPEVARQVVETLREEVDKALPKLRELQPRVHRAVSRAFRSNDRGGFANLSREEALLVQFAAIKVPSDVDGPAGEPASGVERSIERKLLAAEARLGSDGVRQLVDTLQQHDTYGTSWITKPQAAFLHEWLRALHPEPEVLAREETLSTRDVETASESGQLTRVQPVVAVPTLSTEEFLREIFGEEIADTAREKLRPLPPLAQVESRVISLEGVAAQVLGAQGADRSFAFVSKLLASNPHILEMSDFDEYCSALTQTVLRIEKLRLTKPMYDVMASPHHFSSQSSLAQTSARIDMASRYAAAVGALNDIHLPGEAIMALLRYGFFFQGRLQFGPCIGESRMIFENVDKQSERRLLRRDLEKGLSSLQQAGIIARPSRGQGACLSRSAVSGAKNEAQLSKALAWVVAHPDPRVEF
jgi:hypothetical protein